MRSVILVSLMLAFVGVAALAPAASADGVCEVSYQTCVALDNTVCTVKHDEPLRYALADCWNFIGP